MDERFTVEPYRPPEMPKYPDDIPIMVAGMVAILLVPAVFVCAWIWA